MSPNPHQMSAAMRAAIDAAEAEGEIGCEAILAAVAEDKDERRLAAERWAAEDKEQARAYSAFAAAALRRQEMELMDHIAEVVNGGELVAEDIQKPGGIEERILAHQERIESYDGLAAAAAEGAKLLLSGGLMGSSVPDIILAMAKRNRGAAAEDDGRGGDGGDGGGGGGGGGGQHTDQRGSASLSGEVGGAKDDHKDEDEEEDVGMEGAFDGDDQKQRNASSAAAAAAAEEEMAAAEEAAAAAARLWEDPARVAELRRCAERAIPTRKVMCRPVCDVCDGDDDIRYAPHSPLLYDPHVGIFACSFCRDAFHDELSRASREADPFLPGSVLKVRLKKLK